MTYWHGDKIRPLRYERVMYAEAVRATIPVARLASNLESEDVRGKETLLCYDGVM
jgi:hypothetical protein